MKKRIFALVMAIMMLVSVFALAACGDPCAEGHVDADGDELCDNCGASVPKQDDGPGGSTGDIPEEPENEPIYKITYVYYGDAYVTVYEVTDHDDNPETPDAEAPKKDANGKIERELKEDVEVLISTHDVLQSAPNLSDEQKAEKDALKYGGISVVGWYTDASLSTEYDFDAALTADVKVYAKVKDTSKYAGDNIEWEVTKKGVLKLEGKGPMYDFAYPELVPWYYAEDGSRIQITAIEMDKEITTIGSYAFYNLAISKAADVEIAAGVTNIGQYAFAYCKQLKEAPLTVKNKSGEVIGQIKNIERSAFEGCESITRIVIPETVENLDDYAFYACEKATELVLGSGVVTMGDYVFEQKSATGPLNRIFYTGTSEQFNAIESGLGNDLFLPSGAYVYFYVEEDDGTAGPTWSYEKDRNGELYPVYHSYTVRYYPQTKKTGIYPVLVDYIRKDVGTFSKDNLDKKDAIVHRGYKFESWGSASTPYFAGTKKLETDVDFIGDRGSLIGDTATYKMNGTTLQLIGTGSTWNFAAIGETMYSKNIIYAVTFDGITHVGAHALSGIASLITVEIPATVESVDPTAFAGCTNLAAIYVLGDDKVEGLDALVETGAKVYYKASGSASEGSFWADSAEEMNCPECDGVGKVKNSADALVNCTKCGGDGKRVCRFAWSYYDGVLTVGGDDRMPDFAKGSDAPWAVYSDVKQLVIADNVKAVGENAFAALSKIGSITIPTKCQTIPRSAFKGSGYWNESANWVGPCLVANNGKTLLAVDAAKVEGNLIIVPVDVKQICEDAFEGCSAVTAIELPKVIDYIDPNAFAALTSLKTIYYSGPNIHSWNKIANTPSLDGKTIYYFSYVEPETLEGYWHRVDGKPALWTESK